MIYIEVILSEFIYYSPNTVQYKINDIEFLLSNKGKTDDIIDENKIIESLIGRIVIVPFGKKKINALVVNTSNNPFHGLKEEKIKEILGILPKKFSLSKNEISLIYEISNHYFSTLSQTVGLFLPSLVFKPTKKDIEDGIKNEN